jgi:alkylhydroperoxidase family enzyme
MGTKAICERCSQIAHHFSFVISAIASHDAVNADPKDPDATKSPEAEEVAMLDGTRIPPVDIETLPDDLREVLEEQRKLRGAPLSPYLFYARNPGYFRAAHAMWTTLQQETKRVPGALRTLLNRRVAAWNGCEF